MTGAVPAVYWPTCIGFVLGARSLMTNAVLAVYWPTCIGFVLGARGLITRAVPAVYKIASELGDHSAL